MPKNPRTASFLQESARYRRTKKCFLYEDVQSLPVGWFSLVEIKSTHILDSCYETQMQSSEMGGRG
jgi:hypothetical protein